jgi:hypothetical protein
MLLTQDNSLSALKIVTLSYRRFFCFDMAAAEQGAVAVRRTTALPD